jgi:hypothetical protein
MVSPSFQKEDMATPSFQKEDMATPSFKIISFYIFYHYVNVIYNTFDNFYISYPYILLNTCYFNNY